MQRDIRVSRRFALRAAAAAVAGASLLPLSAQAQDTLKIGLIIPMTGPFASTGRQVNAAVKLFLAQNPGLVAGKKVEVLLKDDAGVADTTRWSSTTRSPCWPASASRRWPSPPRRSPRRARRRWS